MDEHMAGGQQTAESHHRKRQRTRSQTQHIAGEMGLAIRATGEKGIDEQEWTAIASPKIAAPLFVFELAAVELHGPTITPNTNADATDSTDDPWDILPCFLGGIGTPLTLGKVAPELSSACKMFFGGFPQYDPAKCAKTSPAEPPVVQWSMGSAGAGAPLHFHNAALNQVLAGAKLWFLFPPGAAVLSSEAAWIWYQRTKPLSTPERKMEPPSRTTPSGLAQSPPLCVLQRAGELLYIPHRWGHVTLNVCDTLAVAIETSETRSQWLMRLKNLKD
eukprot:COSAG05_NODE_1100_length_5884_cov_7.338634_3_plen_275_part_00